MTSLITGIQKKTLNSEDASETSHIQKQNVNPTANHDKTFNDISLKKIIIISNEVYPELKQTRYLSNKHIQPILCKVICEIQNQKATKFNIMITQIVLKVNTYNNILNIYGFMI
jgi:hypothetical protein